MLVRGFMIPAAKVATCGPKDSIKSVVDAMIEKDVGSIVVLQDKQQEGEMEPVGIVTKTDLIKAYQLEMPLATTTVEAIVHKDLMVIKDNVNRDDAARMFKKQQSHHAIVIDATGEHFVGVLSAWDVCCECAREGSAWPWNVSEDGRFHKPS